MEVPRSTFSEPVRWPHPALALSGAAIILGTAAVLWWSAPATSGLGVVEMAWRAVVSPLPAFQELASSDQAAAFGWWFALGYAALYSGTAALLAGSGFIPATPPTVPIPERSYYAWQTLFTLPVGVGATGLGCLVAWGLVGLFGSDVGLVELWGPFAVALIVPTFITMWVPETVGPFLAARGATTDPFPVRFNLVRILAGSVWSVALCVVAVVAAGPALWSSLVAGIVGAAISGGIMATLLR